MNRTNLKLMADYLVTVSDDKFDMGAYRTDKEKSGRVCNTAGCAVGHCTALDTSLPLHGNIDFMAWSSRFTGLNEYSSAWMWCFGAGWARTDNTALGASKRILWLLEHGLPKDFAEQMIGKNKLCYS